RSFAWIALLGSTRSPSEYWQQAKGAPTSPARGRTISWLPGKSPRPWRTLRPNGRSFSTRGGVGGAQEVVARRTSAILGDPLGSGLGRLGSSASEPSTKLFASSG